LDIWKDELTIPTTSITEINTQQWTDYFTHPIRYYLQHVLNIRYENEEEEITDTELFSIDKLQNRNLKNAWFEYDQTIDDFLHEGLRKGKLPLRNMAQATLLEIRDEVVEAKEIWKRLTG